MADEIKEQQNQRFQQMQGQAAPDLAQVQSEQRADISNDGDNFRYCKCGYALSIDDRFCPNCGEEYGGIENICSNCNRSTTKKICPKCQNVVVPYICSKCGQKTIKPVCSCGNILDKKIQAIAALQQQVTEQSEASVRLMSAEEEQEIEEIFRKEEENPDFIKFEKKLLEREKLLAERDYYNKMQKEVIEVFGERPFKIELPDPEEQAARMRLYASLESSIVKKQRLATQVELEAKYPELRYIHEAENKAAEERAAAEEENRKRRFEQEKKLKEVEERYRAILEGVNSEIQEEERKRILAEKAAEEARLKREREEAEERARKEAERLARIAAQEKVAAEERARIDAQRQKEIQAAREQAERQAYLNRIVGTFYYHDRNEKLTIAIDSPNHAYCKDRFKDVIGKIYSEHAVTMRGNDVTLNEIANPSNFNMAYFFQGNLNNNGTILSGYWYYRNGGNTKYYEYHKMP